MSNMTPEEVKKIKLSKNFTLWEFLWSQTAAKHGLMAGQMQVTPETIENLRLLCEKVLQPIRDKFGAVTITSGYRSPALNLAVKGSSNSHHMYGMAADIKVRDMEGAFEYIKNNLKFTQLINEYDLAWIHVSYDSKNLKQQILST